MLLRTLLDVTDADIALKCGNTVTHYYTCPEVEIPLELLNHDVIAVKPFSKKEILLVVSDKQNM